MAQFAITITVPDVNLTLALNGLKRIYPMNSGETNLNYVKRITAMLLTQAAKNGVDILNAEAAVNDDPGITTS